MEFERINCSKEQNSQDKFLEKIYKSEAGRLILKFLTSKAVSEIGGKFMDGPLSVPAIKPFIEKNNIDMSQYEDKKYKSYNDFFTRKIKEGERIFDMTPELLCSPCDSKLTVYKIDEKSKYEIKGTKYSFESLTRSGKLANYYNGGYMLVFRLCVDDYHRYAYVDNGKLGPIRRIDGVYHTVNPVAIEAGYDIYKENTRECSVLHSENFGKILQIEVGAMMVGRIVNNDEKCNVSRGQEKGRFEFGGSTVILAFSKDSIKIKDEIINNSKEDYETIVKMGDVIGEKF